MNCRRLFVIAAAFIGLVPAAQPATAEPTSHQGATATATILQSVNVQDIVRATQQRGLRGTPQPETRRFIDQHGFVTKARSHGAQLIYIVDLP